jgi:hypothetical protein
MKKSFFVFVLINLFYNGNGQVRENMIMERFNMNAFNPAYVGSEGREVSFTTRSSWQGVSGSPKMSYFFYSGNPKNNLSLGASVISNLVEPLEEAAGFASELAGALSKVDSMLGEMGGYAEGGQIPGYGGGDIFPARLLRQRSFHDVIGSLICAVS